MFSECNGNICGIAVPCDIGERFLDNGEKTIFDRNWGSSVHVIVKRDLINRKFRY